MGSASRLEPEPKSFKEHIGAKIMIFGKVLPRTMVDQDYKVWGYENLYVADSSVFRSSVGVNPMQCVYAIGKIFADIFMQNHRTLERVTIRIPKY